MEVDHLWLATCFSGHANTAHSWRACERSPTLAMTGCNVPEMPCDIRCPRHTSKSAQNVQIVSRCHFEMHTMHSKEEPSPKHCRDVLSVETIPVERSVRRFCSSEGIRTMCRRPRLPVVPGAAFLLPTRSRSSDSSGPKAAGRNLAA